MTGDIRAGEWWGHKLAPVLGTGYATAYVAEAELTSVAGALALVLVALVAGAAYVSLLNDLTDQRTDAAAGKPNPASTRTSRRSAVLLAATVVVGWGPVLAFCSGDAAVLSTYAAAWLAFTLYSVPPARLKARGAAGVLADATGAVAMPALFTVAVVLDRSGGGQPVEWVPLVAAWSAALGLRGALQHQLRDVPADERSGVATFAVRHPLAARRTATLVAFPVELLALVGLLQVSGSVAVMLTLPVYVVYELLVVRRLAQRLVVAGPPPAGPHRLALHGFYVVVLPLAFLVAAAVRAPGDAAVLAAHLALFHAPVLALAREARDLFYVVRRDLSPSLVRGASARADD